MTFTEYVKNNQTYSTESNAANLSISAPESCDSFVKNLKIYNERLKAENEELKKASKAIKQARTKRIKEENQEAEKAKAKEAKADEKDENPDLPQMLKGFTKWLSSKLS